MGYDVIFSKKKHLLSLDHTWGKLP